MNDIIERSKRKQIQRKPPPRATFIAAAAQNKPPPKNNMNLIRDSFASSIINALLTLALLFSFFVFFDYVTFKINGRFEFK